MATIFTLPKLYTAYNECKKGKKNSVNALLFEMDREKNLLELLGELQTRSYKISRSICFIVTHPAPREIFAANFRDRIVHHFLYNEIRELFESGFIPHSYANRVGKGTHAAVRELRKDIQHVKRESGSGWYLKLDVQGFFRSIDKHILYGILSSRISGGGTLQEGQNEGWQEEVLWLCQTIIFHDPTTDYVYKGDPALQRLIPESKSLFYSRGLGLPIGNLTSQFFANVYLNELDQFVSTTLGCTRYVRYVDDFVIVDVDPARLRRLVSVIDQFLRDHLRLALHPKKIHLQPTSHGVDFLGYFIKPTHTLVRQKVVRRFKDKLHRHLDPTDGLLPASDIPMTQSYLGHFGHANTYRLQRHLSG